MRFLIRRDRRDAFLFAPLDGKTAQEIAARHEVLPEVGNSVLLAQDFATPQERLLRESDAAFHCLRLLGWPWRIFSSLRFLPRFFRDGLYRLVAKRRYRWFGREESCPVPSAEQQKRFLP